jgi:hypothetical protein
MMSGFSMRIIGAAVTLACAAFGDPGPVVTTEELFRWGEYDSLIRALEPLTQAPGFAKGAVTRADSSDRAHSLLYLGVAYYAKGRTARADSAFRQACALDSGVAMDKFYVTQAISTHFDAIRVEDLRGRLERDARTRAIRPVSGATRAPDAGKRPDQSVWKQDRNWVWWGLGTAAAVAAGGGVYWYAVQSSGPHESITTLDVRSTR